MSIIKSELKFKGAPVFIRERVKSIMETFRPKVLALILFPWRAKVIVWFVSGVSSWAKECYPCQAKHSVVVSKIWEPLVAFSLEIFIAGHAIRSLYLHYLELAPVQAWL